MKFKVGDKVRIKENVIGSEEEQDLAGTVQTISEIINNHIYIGDAIFYKYELEPINPLEDLKVGQKLENSNSTIVIKDVRKTTEYLIEYLKDGSGDWHNIEYLKHVGFHLYTPRKVVKIDGKKYLSSDIKKNCKSINK